MPSEEGRAIHATAVAIRGEALLILGCSRAGKSRLAMALISRASGTRPIELIGDDRILLRGCGGNLVARPHPRIAGFLERRGLGLVAMAFVAEAPVGGMAILSADAGEPMAMLRLPSLQVPDIAEAERADRVLGWWDNRDRRVTPHGESVTSVSSQCERLELVR